MRITIIVMMITCMNIFGQVTNHNTLAIQEPGIVSLLYDYANSQNGELINNGNLYVYKNFRNDGVITYGQNKKSSTVHFVGDKAQYLGGIGTSNYLNINFNNTSSGVSLILEKSIQIYGEVNFLKGIINQSNRSSVTFENNSEHFNLSDDSFFLGKVSKRGNDSFEFPVGTIINGDSFVRPVEIGKPNNQNDLFSAEYFFVNANSLYPNTKKQHDIKYVNNLEYWNIEQEQGTSKVSVTLSWNANTSANEILFADPLDIIIVRWDGNNWVSEGGTVEVGNNKITAVPLGYGIFALGLIKRTIELPTSFSPNGDGINDRFIIPNLEREYPNFNLKVYNRYGSVLYDYYNNGSESPDWWDGKSRGRNLTISNSSVVPAGTYFYVIDFNDGQRKPEQSWLYLNK